MLEAAKKAQEESFGSESRKANKKFNKKKRKAEEEDKVE